MGKIQWFVVFVLLFALSTGCYNDAAMTPPENVPNESPPIQSQVNGPAKEPDMGALISMETVASLQVATIPAGDVLREPLRSDHAEDRKIISRIVEWIRSAKHGQLLTVNGETTRLLPPQVQVVLQLIDGKNVTLEPVCTEEIVSRKTDCHVQEGLVHLYRAGENQPSAIVSPDLANWLEKDYRHETVVVLDNGGSRAIGTNDQGELHLLPVSAERMHTLGAPSCVGQEEDYRISGSYDIVLKKPDGSSQTVQQFKNLVIIQPNLKPFEMRHLSFDRFEAFYFIPQYADCHGLEFYLYGVHNEQAFPFAFHFNGTVQETFPTSPIRDPKVIGGNLVVEGGISAGMDYPIRFTFQPDLAAKTMVLIKQEDIRQHE